MRLPQLAALLLASSLVACGGSGGGSKSSSSVSISSSSSSAPVSSSLSSESSNSSLSSASSSFISSLSSASSVSSELSSSSSSVSSSGCPDDIDCDGLLDAEDQAFTCGGSNTLQLLTNTEGEISASTGNSDSTADGFVLRTLGNILSTTANYYGQAAYPDEGVAGSYSFTVAHKDGVWTADEGGSTGKQLYVVFTTVNNIDESTFPQITIRVDGTDYTPSLAGNKINTTQTRFPPTRWLTAPVPSSGVTSIKISQSVTTDHNLANNYIQFFKICMDR